MSLPSSDGQALQNSVWRPILRPTSHFEGRPFVKGLRGVHNPQSHHRALTGEPCRTRFGAHVVCGFALQTRAAGFALVVSTSPHLSDQQGMRFPKDGRNVEARTQRTSDSREVVEDGPVPARELLYGEFPELSVWMSKDNSETCYYVPSAKQLENEFKTPAKLDLHRICFLTSRKSLPKAHVVCNASGFYFTGPSFFKYNASARNQRQLLGASIDNASIASTSSSKFDVTLPAPLVVPLALALSAPTPGLAAAELCEEDTLALSGTPSRHRSTHLIPRRGHPPPLRPALPPSLDACDTTLFCAGPPRPLVVPLALALAFPALTPGHAAAELCEQDEDTLTLSGMPPVIARRARHHVVLRAWSPRPLVVPLALALAFPALTPGHATAELCEPLDARDTAFFRTDPPRPLVVPLVLRNLTAVNVVAKASDGGQGDVFGVFGSAGYDQNTIEEFLERT
ncbi:hypothetical protein B0H14DRAFT_3533730 [Mycena olivaceomarginata]|nr:hypothetical protein B0H14DRAFT_3533730 [Mycena olivaceomarginata]